MSSGANMRLPNVDNTKAHGASRVWKKTDIKKPLDALWGILHLLTDDLLAEEHLSRMTEPDWACRASVQVGAGSMEVARGLRVLDWPKSWTPMVI